jgi:hypothetical protein
MNMKPQRVFHGKKMVGTEPSSGATGRFGTNLSKPIKSRPPGDDDYLNVPDTPLDVRNTPLDTRVASLEVRNTPLGIRMAPLKAGNMPLDSGVAPLEIRNTSLDIRMALLESLIPCLKLKNWRRVAISISLSLNKTGGKHA